MTLTFVTFFTFVVNTGLLVNAKINLQNAADLAAYAGAATQARQLNDISFLNYEMRRQFKKFLFRYYVIGNMAQISNPSTRGPGGLRLWSPNSNPSQSHGVPVTCIIFNPDDNYCQVYSLEAIPINTSYNALDQLSATLQQNLEELNRIRDDSCKAIGYTNAQILLFWLLNTEPNLETFEQSINSVTSAGSASQADANETIRRALPAIKGISSGLGLVPRNILLSMRIKTLEDYVNLAPQKDMDYNKVNQLNGGAQDKPMHERPIQAFLSAFNTLGEYTFPAESIKMTEILPETDDKANLLELIPVKTSFETYFTKLRLISNRFNNALNDCQATPQVVPMRNVPVGFYKDPSKMTYYSVQLQADVELPFSPFRKVTMKAYAAAKPFGSRIGPFFENAESDFPFINPGAKPTQFLSLDGNSQNKCPEDCYGIPNLELLAENDSPSRGWNQVEVLSAYYGALRSIANEGRRGGSAVSAVGPQELERAYQVAMAPNPSERAKYNILTSLPQLPGATAADGSSDPYQISFPNAQTLNHTIWAPLISDANTDGEDASALVVQEFEKQLEQLKPAVTDEHIDAFTESMQAYIGKLKDCENNQSSVENGECFYATHITEPFFYKSSQGPQRVRLPASVMITDIQKDINTSFAKLKNETHSESGRVGYSVKFVSFDTLLNSGEDNQPTTGPNSNSLGVWTNRPTLPDDAQSDVQRLKH